MKVGIVTVNYKSADLTLENLRSIVNLKSIHELKVVIIDNDSKDGSVQKISNYISENNLSDMVTLIASDVNGGFAYGCNLGINLHKREYNPDFYWLLNPDARALPFAMDELVSALLKYPQVGIVGSRLENEDESPRNSAFNFHTWKTELVRGFGLRFIDKIFLGRKSLAYHAYDEAPIITDWVSGASMMIKQNVIAQVGLMDEKYFLYYEEMDFCYKATMHGWQCLHVPTSRVIHVAGSSSGINSVNQPEKRRPIYWFDSRRRFFVKNYGKLHAASADFFWLLGFATWMVRNYIQKKQHKNPPFFLIDSFRNSVFMKGFRIE